MSTNEAVLSRKYKVLLDGVASIRRQFDPITGPGIGPDSQIRKALQEELDHIDRKLQAVQHLTRDEAFELLEAACVEYDGDGTALNFAKAVMRVREQTKHFSVFYASGGEGD